MVGSIPHDIAFGMCHVVSKGIPHNYVVCFLAMWYAFLTHLTAHLRYFMKYVDDILHLRNYLTEFTVSWLYKTDFLHCSNA